MVWTKIYGSLVESRESHGVDLFDSAGRKHTLSQMHDEHKIDKIIVTLIKIRTDIFTSIGKNLKKRGARCFQLKRERAVIVVWLCECNA